MMFATTLGKSAADEEASRGWQVPGVVDERVWQALIWDLSPYNFVRGRDGMVVQFESFLLHAGYFNRWMGETSLEPLAEEASKSGFRFRDLSHQGETDVS